MANTQSAKKRIRTHERNRMQNKLYQTRVKNAVKRFEEALKSDDREQAEAALKTAHGALDRAAQKSNMHVNKANRLKSRLAKRFDRAFAAE